MGFLRFKSISNACLFVRVPPPQSLYHPSIYPTMKSVIFAAAIASAAAFAPAPVAKTSSSALNAFENELGAQAPLGFFDPLGMLEGADQAEFDRLREVEIKHGRWVEFCWIINGLFGMDGLGRHISLRWKILQGDRNTHMGLCIGVLLTPWKRGYLIRQMCVCVRGSGSTKFSESNQCLQNLTLVFSSY